MDAWSESAYNETTAAYKEQTSQQPRVTDIHGPVRLDIHIDSLDGIYSVILYSVLLCLPPFCPSSPPFQSRVRRGGKGAES